MYPVETIEQWTRVEKRLCELSARLYMTQYGCTYPEGFHAWFIRPNSGVENSIELVTHDEAVCEAIFAYHKKQRT